jgi:hypothetical protein
MAGGGKFLTTFLLTCLLIDAIVRYVQQYRDIIRARQSATGSIKEQSDRLPLFGKASIVPQDDTKDQSDRQAGRSKDALNNDSAGMREDGVCQSGAPSCLGSLLIIIDVARTLYKLETRLPRTVGSPPPPPPSLPPLLPSHYYERAARGERGTSISNLEPSPRGG